MSVDSRVWTVRDGPVRGAKVPIGINVGIGVTVVVLAAFDRLVTWLAVTGSPVDAHLLRGSAPGWSRKEARRV